MRRAAERTLRQTHVSGSAIMRSSIRPVPGQCKGLTPRAYTCIYNYMLPAQAVFGINIVASFAVWGIILATFAWPVLQRVDRTAALRGLLALHCFRFVGLAFIVPGVVSPLLP